jgi:RsiW-degrading membrane proteinase PrsW (M82 family)
VILSLLYWGLGDDLASAVVVLMALSVYFSLAITRVSRGAPRAWYLFIAAFSTCLVYRAVQLYFDTQSSSSLINNWEVLLSLIAGALLLGGLVMLTQSFRRQLKAIQPTQ